MSDRSDSISPPPPDEIIDQQAEESANASTSMPPPKSKGKAKQKSTDAGASRSKGTTILPAARVSRIIKADNEIDICSKEASFLISIATEQFIKHFAETGYSYAKTAKRKAVNYQDLSSAVDQRWHLGFLKEIVPTTMPLSAALAQRNRLQEASYQMEAGALEELLERPDGTIDPQLKAFADNVQTHANIGAGGKKIVNKKPKAPTPKDDSEQNGNGDGEASGSGSGSGSNLTTSRSGRIITTPGANRDRGDSVASNSRNEENGGGDVEMDGDQDQRPTESNPNSTSQASNTNGSGSIPAASHPVNGGT